MSHTGTIKAKLTDLEAVKRACARLGFGEPVFGAHRLFDNRRDIGEAIEGHAVAIPGWQYPVIIRPDGSIAYDTYKGKWGNEADLGKLQAAYGLEYAMHAAWLQGYSVTEGIDDQSNFTLDIDIPQYG